MDLPFKDEVTKPKNESDLERVATIYITQAVYSLAQIGYQGGARYRKAAAKALLAISYEAQAGNHDRAKGHLMVVERVFKQMTEQEDHDIARGFGYEWLGDAYVMVRDVDEALSCYEKAKDLFDGHDWETRWAWGGRPEYDDAYLAARQFFAEHGFDYPETHDVEFLDRVEWKADVAEQFY